MDTNIVYRQPPTTAAPDATMRPILLLALGTFAVGTEAFMIAPLLTDMARDLGVGLGAAGQLVTIYTFAYALGSPVLR